MEPRTLSAQQAAIRELRRRFEHGELAYDDFRRGLDALLLARDASECEVILRELPTAPLAVLNALDVLDGLDAQDAAPVATSQPQRKRIVAYLGETKKMRRPWQLAPSTQVKAVMGEVKLDLTRAALPSRARIQITAVMGTVTLYVPSATRVAVRSRVYLGDAHLLGESASGVVAFGQAEHVPSPDPPSAELEIEALVVMGNLKVALADGPVFSLGELLGDTVRAALEGVRRGLQAPHTSAPQRLTGDQ
jgi:Cell wall-active antibiotics response LiaF, C-terminal